jgi:uncharacterized protein YjbI with pentapeptide repeats
MPSVTRVAKDVAAKIWPVITARSLQTWRWLNAPREPTVLRARGYPLSSTYGGRFVVAAGIFLLLLIFVLPWRAQERSWISEVWDFYTRNKDALTPLLAPLGAILVGIGTVAVGIGTLRVSARQARTAAQQAQIAQRGAITTAFYNAVSRLASDKIEERLGGIYTLGRISQESADDYWTVIETLTAFVRERAKWQPEAIPTEGTAAKSDYWVSDAASPRLTPDPGQDYSESVKLWLAGYEASIWPSALATDIQAVLAVIGHRPDAGRAREQQFGWRVDLRATDLRGAKLREAHLERALFTNAHLEDAFLFDAHLEGAELWYAHLERAKLVSAHLEGASLFGAHLEGALLLETHLEGATIWGAHLEGADLRGAHLERAGISDSHFNGVHLEGAILNGAHLSGANLSEAEGLTQEQIDVALGDAKTKLPAGLTRPAHWPEPEAGAAPASRPEFP